jgi:2-oxoglutarate ferredoxin oxidoreductase subunit beta
VLPARAPITVDYAEGSVQVVEQHDGSKLVLRKLDADYELHDRYAAMAFLQRHAAEGQIVTGVLHIAPDAQELHASLKTVRTPLNALTEKELCPGAAALDRINAGLR